VNVLCSSIRKVDALAVVYEEFRPFHEKCRLSRFQISLRGALEPAHARDLPIPLTHTVRGLQSTLLGVAAFAKREARAVRTRIAWRDVRAVRARDFALFTVLTYY